MAKECLTTSFVVASHRYFALYATLIETESQLCFVDVGDDRESARHSELKIGRPAKWIK